MLTVAVVDGPEIVGAETLAGHVRGRTATATAMTAGAAGVTVTKAHASWRYKPKPQILPTR